MKARLLECFFAILFALSALSKVDAQCTISANNTNNYYYGFAYAGQLFTTTCAGNLTSITFYYTGAQSYGITATIRNSCNGTILGTASTSGSVVTGANIITFSPGVPVSNASSYAFQLSRTGGGNLTDGLELYTSDGSLYSGGNSYIGDPGGYFGDCYDDGGNYDLYFSITVSNSITNSVSAGAYCAGAPASVSYTAAGTFNSGNTFTAQLSDASGSFASPVNIGSVSSTSSGTISATIPSGASGGTGYRIRVVSSNPSTIGADNGSNIIINATPTVNPISNQVVCNGAATATVTLSGAASGTVFNWTNNMPSIGLESGGVGTGLGATIPSFTATNSTSAPLVGTVTVTPMTGLTTQVFNYTGGAQTFTVPSGITSINVTMYGAQGGGGVQGANLAQGGKGGMVTATLAVTPGQVLQVNVGGAGFTPSGSIFGFTGHTGGYNGGGNSMSSSSTVTRGSGGGATDVRTGAYGLSDRVLVAGGGGGGAGLGTGGDGGGLTGETGTPNSGTYGTGGTQSAGGTQTTTGLANPMSSGALAQGGSGGYDGSVNTYFVQSGGGGGYYGGAAGIGGGGGSSFIGGSGVSGTNTVTGVRTGNGEVIISYTTSVACSGTPTTFTYTVNQTPTVVATPTAQTICNGASITTINLKSNAAGTVYNWARTNTSNVAGISASGIGNISGSLLNSLNSPQTTTFTITPSYTNAGVTCAGSTATASVTVNPTLDVAQPASQVLCNNGSTAAVTFTGTSTSTTYNWTNNNTSIGLAASGTGNIPSFTATNPGGSAATATITVTPTTNSTTTAVYSYTGSTQTFTVPAGVTSLKIAMFGAQGGGGIQGTNTAIGGKGGAVMGTLAVTPGEVLQVRVGGAGVTPNAGSIFGFTGHTGGYNGGGNSMSSSSTVTRGSGGGATDVRTGAYGLSDRVLVAGGGGGGAGLGTGGNGGGLIGGDGIPNVVTWGSGGTQVFGGYQTTSPTSLTNPNGSGSLALGGSGGLTGSGYFIQSGGGGGFYGGAAGIGGGGGSSYTAGTGVTGGTTVPGVNTGDGSVVITYASTCTGPSKTFTITVDPTLVVTSTTVTPQYPMSGQEVQTIYLNYPASAQSETIATTPSGGSGAYSYLWQKSNCNGSTMSTISGASNSSYTWSPTSADACSSSLDNVYTFTVTVSDGVCSSVSSTKKLNLVTPYTGTGDVQLCHRAALRGATLYQTMTVPPSQVSTHLGHGDILGGNCSFFTGKQVQNLASEPDQFVAVYPNPNTGVFVVELAEVQSQASIMITDATGKFITSRTLSKDATPTTTFDMSNYSKGVYLIQIRDGELNYRSKVVVQ